MKHKPVLSVFLRPVRISSCLGLLACLALLGLSLSTGGAAPAGAAYRIPFTGHTVDAEHDWPMSVYAATWTATRTWTC